MENKNNERPLILAMKDAEDEIVQSINKSLNERGLPCYLMVPILSRLLLQVQEGAKNELSIAQKQELISNKLKGE